MRFFIGIGVAVVIFSAAVFFSGRHPQSRSIVAGDYPEVKELKEQNLDFQKLSVYFTDLAEKKGAAYGYEVLKAIPVPPNIDMHLLGHVVGDVLYRQQGLEGIKICTHDFRNACSHSIVVGLFLEKGTAALPEIARACRNAPGGSGAYTMCFHGLGHGILAYADYDLEKTIDLCHKTGTPAYNNREYVECVGGAVMELISGGFHDPKLWATMRPRYLKKDHPLSLCMGHAMPLEVRNNCIIYITPYLFEAAGANMGSPNPEDFVKAFHYCDALPPADSADRDACFGGFGKEFTGLVLGRDIRSAAIASIGDEQFKKVYAWCRLAEPREGGAACITNAMNSFFWGGENDRRVATRFCSLIPMSDGYHRRTCFMNLIDSVGFYIQDATYKKEFCGEAPEEYTQACNQKLGL